MKDIKVDKQRLIGIVKENRAKHVAIFEEAMAGYRKMLEDELVRRLDELRQGKKIVRIVGMAVPDNRTKDYDRILRMLELHEEPFIFMPEADIQMYVMDDWQWKRNFLLANATYSKIAADTLAGDPDTD